MKRFRPAILAVLALSVGKHGHAQERRILPEGDFVARVIGDQREPRLSAKLLGVTQGASRFGPGIEGEAAVGRTFPIYLFSGSAAGDYVALTMGAGVWGRFNMETAKKHHISADWNFRLPFMIKRGNTRYALSYNHISSHLGDEYIDRFNEFTNDYSIDNLRALVFRRVGSNLELYGGGAFAVNITPSSFDRLAAQFGAQIPEFRLGSSNTGFAGLDVIVDQNADWAPRVSVRTGITFFPESANRSSLVLDFLTGPSSQGQFINVHETFIGLGVMVGW